MISNTQAQLKWTASWIGLPSLKETNTWVCYTKNFNCKNIAAEAITQIATDSKYWLYINGMMVVREGQLKRGPNPSDTYYDELDIAPYLKAGNNNISILTWYWGKNGFSHNSSGQTALLFQCAALNLVSDTSWYAKIHPAYFNPVGLQPNFRLAETNVGFDATKDVDWIGVIPAGWLQATSFGNPPVSPWNNLVKRPIPSWKDFGLKDYKKTASSFNEDTVICSLPYNAQVNPYFKIDAPAGLHIDILTDNYLSSGKTELASVRTEYITKEGIQEFECPNWMNGHLVYYRIPKGVRILKLQYRETGYATTLAGSFTCDDTLLNLLWNKSQRTLYLNMRDNYFDCPDRERAQWWGDLVIEIGQSFYGLDTFANQLTRKAIHNLIDWQQEDSSLFSPIPAGNWTQELPVQTLASICGINTYFQYTGDSALIKNIYPAVKKYMELWKPGSDSLIVHRKGGWDWADWGKNIDVPLLDNGWYYLAGQTFIQWAVMLNDEATVKKVQQICDAIKRNFNKKFWNNNEYRSPGYAGETDERGHALAVLAGIADKSNYPAIKKIFKEQYHASPYMEKYVLESLFAMNDAEAALHRMKMRYKKMITDPGSTLWELFSLEEGGSTNNHAWTGGPLTLLSQYAAGVAPQTPGYDIYHIFPQMGSLKKIQTVHQTIKGKLWANLSNLQGVFTLQTNGLPGATGIIGIPSAKENTYKTIVLDGVTLWKNGSFNKQQAVVNYLGYKDGFIQFSIQNAGEYTFEAKQ